MIKREFVAGEMTGLGSHFTVDTRLSDEELRRAVVHEIQWIEAPVAVAVMRGVVLLTGSVDGAAVRITAEEAVLAVPGVVSVINEIRSVSNESISASEVNAMAEAHNPMQPLSRFNLSADQLRFRLHYKVRYHVGPLCPDVDWIANVSVSRLLADERLSELRTREDVGVLLNSICSGVIADYRNGMRAHSARRGRSVLVVDDVPNNRELVRTLLEISGYAVNEADNGVDAIRMADESRPDLILLDIHMPGLDGFQVLRRLREEYNLLQTPIVALTADTRAGMAEEALAAGFTSYLPLPASLVRLRTEIGRLLPN